MPLALILSAVLGFATGSTAWANDPFPVREDFRGAAFGTQWRSGGSAELTGAKEAEGWLRLTAAEGGEFGYAYDDEAFPSTAGALVEFEYADWGGSGADGLTFFLFDGSTGEAEFHAGQPGGSLGYAPCYSTTNGLSGGYVGIGFDEYGNFSNLGSICGLDGYEFLANHVSIRGSAAESYKLLATAPTTESLRADRSQARRVTIAVTPTGKLSVYVGYPDGTYQQVTEGFQLPVAPATLKFGYVASTGALTDYHEIRGAQVVKPTQLTPSVAQTGGGGERGKPLTWTAVVRNEGPNPTQREQLRTTMLGQAPANATWTCEAAGGAECGTTEGTGLPNPEAGAMPQGSSLTYTITGTPTPTTDYAQLTVESEPRGDTGELDPEKERASARTNLVPLFEEEPTFTLAADGEAAATTVSALGGEISYGYAWQRCEANGTDCANIPGAQAPIYKTTSADIGHTIRFTETATNSAGSDTVDSAVYRLPTAEITAAPSGSLPTREAVLAFMSSTNEAELECSLDGAAWSACASPLSYEDLPDGEHTFSVRATHGGLSDPSAASAQWTTEATPPPSPTIVSAPSSPSPPSDAAFRFGDLVAGDTLECQLDRGGWGPCGAFTEFAGLAEGGHELQVRQVNRASLASGATGYTWKIEAAPPVGPILLSASGAESAAPTLGGALPIADPALVRAAHTAHARRRAGGHATRRRRRQRDRTHRASTHPQRSQHKHPAGKPRHIAAHRHRAIHHRHPAVHRHRAERHRHSGGHKRKFTATPHADRHKRKSTASPRTVRHTPNSTRPRHTDAHKRNATSPRHGVKLGTHPPADTSQPKSTTRGHTPSGHTSPPAAQHRPKDYAPGSAPGPVGEPHRRAPRHAAHMRRPAAKHAPKLAPKTGGKREHRKRLPPTGPPRSRKRRARSKTHGIGRKPHGPASRPSPKQRARHSTRAAGPNLVIRPFMPRSYALVNRARRRVKRIAAAVPRARLIICVGYTDNLGPRSANVALGLKRARAVCAKLRALGVHATFKAESRGPQRPCASNATARGRALNRRVELRIVRRPV